MKLKNKAKAASAVFGKGVFGKQAYVPAGGDHRSRITAIKTPDYVKQGTFAATAFALHRHGLARRRLKAQLFKYAEFFISRFVMLDEIPDNDNRPVGCARDVRRAIIRNASFIHNAVPPPA
jgi:hypothetical protein